MVRDFSQFLSEYQHFFFHFFYRTSFLYIIFGPKILRADQDMIFFDGLLRIPYSLWGQIRFRDGEAGFRIHNLSTPVRSLSPFILHQLQIFCFANCQGRHSASSAPLLCVSVKFYFDIMAIRSLYAKHTCIGPGLLLPGIATVCFYSKMINLLPLIFAPEKFPRFTVAKILYLCP